VRPDRLAVVVRPRVGWEALDLGFQMAREWWRPIWAVWACAYLPVAGLCLLVFSNRFHALLLLWWLKPVFDRAVLHTASRAVFGEPQGALATIRAVREWLPPGLVTALTLSRLNLARSFALPVAQLERQRGADSRRRQAALGRRMRNVGVWLTVVCANLEWVVMLGLAALIGMLEPSAAEPGPEDNDTDHSFWAQFAKWGLREALFYVAAVSLIEPFYVTAGFALYLNRRAILEGWDIELALRRLEERVRSSAKGAATVAVLVVALGCAMWVAQPVLALDDAPKSAQTEIRAVLASPEFSQTREITRWRYVGPSRTDTAADREVPTFWLYLSALFGEIAAYALWIAAAMLVVLALYFLSRFAPEPRLRTGPGYRPPSALFGFDMAPETLPADVASTAAGLARDGRLREALSLLYRGALSALIHRHHLPVGPGDTEGDCVRAVGRTLPQSADYFIRLVGAWQTTAYAARVADAGRIEQLCSEWRGHFAPGATP
jgi:hypothetical protein